MSLESNVNKKQVIIAILTIALLSVYFISFLFEASFDRKFILAAILIFGGIPLVIDLFKKLIAFEFGSDLLAGISIVTSVLLDEYLAGSLVVLMLSGGEALEAYAVKSASSALEALAKRMPNTAHLKTDSGFKEIEVSEIKVGSELLIFPHEICPVDGVVLEGFGSMDEAYLTGEPYKLSKSPGSAVLSGSINGNTALTIKATKLAIDSRYAKIMEVMRRSEQERPKIQRLGDQLGAYYTPLALIIGILAWYFSSNAKRFLAVMVVATPCPLLIAIPVAIIGSISLAAKRAIIIRNPVVLEKIATCKTIIFDKTGTLTYGTPELTEQILVDPTREREVLALVASLEEYSRHPLSIAITNKAKEMGLPLKSVSEIHEEPGKGLNGLVSGQLVEITGRNKLIKRKPELEDLLPALAGGLECVILVNNEYIGLYRFRDVPRKSGKPFIQHLDKRHKIDKVMILSGDREIEVKYLAEQVGIPNVLADKSPEEKLEIVKAETLENNSIYVGDGINDAPALVAATVGVAFGQNSDVTSEAAGAIILDSSLEKVDELLHIGERMRRIALQSAVGGMSISVVGMLVASFGLINPVTGAVIQEIIDVIAVLNALRAAQRPRELTDF